jgi:hypothetical protein
MNDERSVAMDFALSDEQKMVQEMARDFAENEIKPKAPELDKSERHPAEIVQKMAERDRITVMCTSMEVDKIVNVLREQEW